MVLDLSCSSWIFNCLFNFEGEFLSVVDIITWYSRYLCELRLQLIAVDSVLFSTTDISIHVVSLWRTASSRRPIFAETYLVCSNQFVEKKCRGKDYCAMWVFSYTLFQAIVYECSCL